MKSPYEITCSVCAATGIAIALYAVFAEPAHSAPLANQAPAHYANKPFLVEPIIHRVHPKAVQRKCWQIARRRNAKPLNEKHIAGCAVFDTNFTYCEIVIPKEDWPPYIDASYVELHEFARCKGYTKR